tara:strand:+ start:555 stop:854 length:300 start_codon:yes stop_codon:yes gene_type:complete
MVDYIAVYDVSFQSRIRDEYDWSWEGNFSRRLVKFEAEDDEVAKQNAEGEILETLSLEYEGSGSRNLLSVKLKSILEARIVEDSGLIQNFIKEIGNKAA